MGHKAPHLARADYLDIQKIEEILTSQYHKSSQYLDLQNFNQQWKCVMRYGNNTGTKWNKLRFLRLNFCQIIGHELKILLSIKFESLKTLSLTGNNLGNNGMKILTKAYLPTLQSLGINNCEIGTQGAKNISKANWENLKYLYIENNYINIDAVKWLVTGRFRYVSQISCKQEARKSDIIFGILLAVIAQSRHLKIGVNNNWLRCRCWEHTGRRK